MANAMRPYVNINSNTFSPDDKETMKGLNDRLAGYLSNVRLLEDSNNTLEEQIKDALMRKSNETGRDWSAYEKTITDLRNQVSKYKLLSDFHPLFYYHEQSKLGHTCVFFMIFPTYENNV